jgi:hypothetical protein
MKQILCFAILLCIFGYTLAQTASSCNCTCQNHERIENQTLATARFAERLFNDSIRSYESMRSGYFRRNATLNNLVGTDSTGVNFRFWVGFAISGISNFVTNFFNQTNIRANVDELIRTINDTIRVQAAFRNLAILSNSNDTGN